MDAGSETLTSRSFRLTNSSIFVSKRNAVLLIFLAVVLVVGSGILGGFFGPGRLKVGASTSALKAATTTPVPKLSTPKPKDQLWHHLRLPKWISPIHYRLKVHVNISDDRFNGSVDIKISCKKESRYILLHSKYLNILSVVVLYEDGSPAEVARYFLFTKNDYCVIEMNTFLKVGKATIKIRFNAAMSPDLNGLYTSNYQELNGKIGKVAATFYAPIAARKSFPCFDEPAYKANFTVSLIYDKKYTAVSNMPITQKRNITAGLMQSDFQTSVKMSTYLLCFVVGNFGYKETVSANGVRIRVWAPKHVVQQGTYSLKAANHTLTYFEDLFGIRYPLPKVDMVALPNFMAGAMENWGLITYRSTRLLTRSDVGSEREKQNILIIVAHELAHQWFGNLVTMEWWNDVWLNEGFASFIEYFGANSFEPSMNVHDQFLLLDLYPVMQLDSYVTSHPLSMKVETPDNINQIFDTVTYNKGASVIRMMKEFLGHDNFFQGLRNYLSKYAYGNANQDNLWQELRNVSNFDVKTVMDTWTLQLGFPFISVTRIDQKKVKLTQEQFSLDDASLKTVLPHSPFNYTWQIPFTCVEEKDPLTIKSAVLRSKSMTLDIPDKGWFKLNKNHAGYFRVLYDSDNWNKLTTQLFKNHTVFSAMDRANLIADIFSLAHAGKVSYRTALKSTQYLHKETEWVPWKTGIDSVSKMNRILSKTCTTKKMLHVYLNKLVEPVVNSLGWRKQTRVADSYLQTAAVQVAGLSGNENVTATAWKYFRNWMDNKAPIPSNFKPLVYFIGVRNGGEREWKYVFNEYQTTKNIGDKRSLLNALGATKEYWVLQRFLDYSLDESRIAKEDGTAAIVAAAKASSDGRFLAWEFVQANWEKIMKKYGDGIFLVGRMIRGVLNDFSNEYELKMVEKFFKDKTNLGTAAQAVHQAIQSIRGNINWKKKHEDDVKAWLMDVLPKGTKLVSFL